MIFIGAIVIIILVLFVIFKTVVNGGFDENLWTAKTEHSLKTGTFPVKYDPACSHVPPQYEQLKKGVLEKFNLPLDTPVKVEEATVDMYLKSGFPLSVMSKPTYNIRKQTVIELMQSSQPDANGNYKIESDVISKEIVDKWMLQLEKLWKPSSMNWRGRDGNEELKAKPWGENVDWPNNISNENKIKYEKVLYAWTRFNKNMYRHINESYWKFPPIDSKRYYLSWTDKNDVANVTDLANMTIKRCLNIRVLNQINDDLHDALLALKSIDLGNNTADFKSYNYVGKSVRYMPENAYSDRHLLDGVKKYGKFLDAANKTSLVIPYNEMKNVPYVISQFTSTAHRNPLSRYVDVIKSHDPVAKINAIKAEETESSNLSILGSQYENYKDRNNKYDPLTKYTFIINDGAVYLPVGLTESLENEAIIIPGTKFQLSQFEKIDSTLSNPDKADNKYHFTLIQESLVPAIKANGGLSEPAEDVDDDWGDDNWKNEPGPNSYAYKVDKLLDAYSIGLEKEFIDNKLVHGYKSSDNAEKKKHIFDIMSSLKDRLTSGEKTATGNDKIDLQRRLQQLENMNSDIIDIVPDEPPVVPPRDDDDIDDGTTGAPAVPASDDDEPPVVPPIDPVEITPGIGFGKVRVGEEKIANLSIDNPTGSYITVTKVSSNSTHIKTPGVVNIVIPTGTNYNIPITFKPEYAMDSIIVTTVELETSIGIFNVVIAGKSIRALPPPPPPPPVVGGPPVGGPVVGGPVVIPVTLKKSLIDEDEENEFANMWRRRLTNYQRINNDEIMSKIFNTMIKNAYKKFEKRLDTVKGGSVEKPLDKLADIISKLGIPGDVKTKKDLVEKYLELISKNKKYALIDMAELRKIGL